MDDDALLDYWRTRQDELAGLLDVLATGSPEYRVDLESGRFYWIEADDRPIVVAACKVLASYALSDRSILMGWANDRSPATIDPIEGLPDSILDVDESDAWLWAMRAALGAGADFIYRAPNPQMWVFLGLWSVRVATADDRFDPGSPEDYVQYLLSTLGDVLARGVEQAEALRAVLFENYGRTLHHMARFGHRGTPYAARLRDVGDVLIEVGEAIENGPLDAAAIARLQDKLRELEGLRG